MGERGLGVERRSFRESVGHSVGIYSPNLSRFAILIALRYRLEASAGRESVPRAPVLRTLAAMPLHSTRQ